MKKIINLFLISLISFTGFSQVNYDNIITSKYVKSYVWDYNQEEYIEETSDWITSYISPFEDYYLFSYEEEEESKVWWEYDSFNKELDGDVYYTEGGIKIIFLYEAQQVWFFGDFSEKNNRYETLFVLDKIEVEEK